MDIGIWGWLQEFQDARSRFFRQAILFLIALTYHYILKSNFVLHFCWTQPTLHSDFNMQDSTLASKVNMCLNSVHICLCLKEKNHLQINKKKKMHTGNYLSDCSLKKIVQNYGGICSNCKLLKHFIDVFDVLY